MNEDTNSPAPGATPDPSMPEPPVTEPLAPGPSAASASQQDARPTAGTDAAAPVTNRVEAGAVRRSGRWKRIALITLVVLLVAAGAVGGVAVYQQLDRVRTAQARLDAAAALLDGAEERLLEVDSAVQAEISSEIATQSVEAIEVAQQVRADAIAAEAIIVEILPDLAPDMLQMAEALKDSAAARVEMMEAAPVILEADRKAALAIDPADEALEAIKAAEAHITTAVAEFNKHTEAGVKASTANSEQARLRLVEARSLLETSTAAFPEADYDAFIEYVDAKIALIADSKQIDSLWLAGKVQESNAKLDAYNKKDAEIVAMAKALPASVRDPIADAYEDITAEARKRYFDAREQARVAGDRVRALRESSTRDR
ncbi:MAG: hypothetical protein ISP10_00950 [Aeromicrobium sp.]|nr:hypothetical protein [Aeromicrobium sp.]